MSAFEQFRTAGLVAAALVASIGVAKAAAAPATQSFDVFARENSLALGSNDGSPLDTGIIFSVGDALRITASGT